MKPLMTELIELPPARKWLCAVHFFAGWQMTETVIWLLEALFS